ncbi:MAG TPA: AI-2E family transporter [Streptosporangiaceae bacterium]
MTSDRKVADEGRSANGAVAAGQAAESGDSAPAGASQAAGQQGPSGQGSGDHAAGTSVQPAGAVSAPEQEFREQEQQVATTVRVVRTEMTRRAKLWAAAESRGVPLQAILTTVAVVVLVYLAGKIVFRIREVILLMAVAGFVALLLNPLVLILQRWLRRRGFAITVVTLFAVLVFAGLAFAFGYPLVNGITHLSNSLPGYIRQAESGQGWIGHLVTKYHVQSWVQQNAPKLAGYGKNLASPALTVGKGALSLMLALLTIFVLVVLLLLEGPKIRGGLLGMMTADRAERYSRVAREVNRSVTGYMLGNFATSMIAGAVVFVTLLPLGVPFPFLWALWVALVDFLPMIGGALAGIPTVLFAVAHSLTAGIVTLVVFLIYTQVENHVLNPVIMSKTVRINPLLVLVAILVAASLGAWLGGFFGGFVAALLAIPLAGAGQVLVREVWLASGPGGHRIGEEPGQRR